LVSKKIAGRGLAAGRRGDWSMIEDGVDEPGSERTAAARAMAALAPPELGEAIEAASRAYDELEASGRQLRFSLDPFSGRLAIELVDLDGRRLGELTASQVLDVAETGHVG
jgi:hypothetical protein